MNVGLLIHSTRVYTHTPVQRDSVLHTFVDEDAVAIKSNNRVFNNSFPLCDFFLANLSSLHLG